MPATTEAWASLWFSWLVAVALTWLVLEVGSLLLARARGQKVIETWTLSDCIRRWSAARRWLAPLAVGIICALLWHFFGQQNPV